MDLYIVVVAVVVAFFLVVALFNRYRRCPSDKILVIYGTSTAKGSAKCVHGGGAFVWPIIQDYAYMSLTPLSIDANLTNALSRQNIRVDVPCRFTVGISTEPATFTARWATSLTVEAAIHGDRRRERLCPQSMSNLLTIPRTVPNCLPPRQRTSDREDMV